LIGGAPINNAYAEKIGADGYAQELIGGAPINNAYAEKIGADGYAQDASRAVKLAKSLI